MSAAGSVRRSSKRRENGRELRRERRIELHLLAGARMGQLQLRRMEEGPRETGKACPSAVAGVASDGVLDRREVDPDLVGAAGLEVEAEKSARPRLGEALEHRV